MTASPGLLVAWPQHSHHYLWSKWHTRVIALAIGVGALMAFTVLVFIAEAH
jgi:hypothetical protein